MQLTSSSIMLVLLRDLVYADSEYCSAIRDGNLVTQRYVVNLDVVYTMFIYCFHKLYDKIFIFEYVYIHPIYTQYKQMFGSLKLKF